MDAIHLERPPAYTNTDPKTLILPSVPTHELPPHNHINSQFTLPDLRSLGLPAARPSTTSLNQSPHGLWGSYQQQAYAYQTQLGHHGSTGSMPPPSPMDTDSVMSDGRRFRAPSIMSLDDPETREAAETLSGLRNMDFKRSSSAHSSNGTTLHSLMHDDMPMKSPDHAMDDDQEPLLSLVTSTHPWIGGTINTSIYAYNSTMNYSPAFVQTFIEKNVGTVANGLGTISRKTGVETRVRHYLGDTPERRTRRENERTGTKRPREHSPDHDDLEKGLSSPSFHPRQRSRTGSQASFGDMLPAYDENRSPPYEQQSKLTTQAPPQSWKSRLMITTSGLGVALSDASLRSLKFCLSLLRQASTHLAQIMIALRTLIREYEQTIYSSQASPSQVDLTPDQEAASQAMAERIKEYGSDIMKTLETVTINVSRYTGGALPENAGALVRRQLLSVPHRWRLAQEASSPPSTDGSPAQTCNGNGSESMRTGQRWLVFAEQGFDMIAQVAMVLDGTVESAERWLDSMGRRRRRSELTSPTTEHKSLGSSGLSSPRVLMSGEKMAPPRTDLASLRTTEKR